MTTHAQGELMTIREIAKEFSVTPRTVHNWVAWGKLKFVRIGRTIRFPREQFAAKVKEGAA